MVRVKHIIFMWTFSVSTRDKFTRKFLNWNLLFLEIKFTDSMKPKCQVSTAMTSQLLKEWPSDNILQERETLHINIITIPIKQMVPKYIMFKLVILILKNKSYVYLLGIKYDCKGSPDPCLSLGRGEAGKCCVCLSGCCHVLYLDMRLEKNTSHEK